MASDARHVGELAGSYRLTRELGRGGMGIVYEAVHEGLGQRVAVKVMAAHLAHDPIARQRFRREALASSKVEHPGLVRVFDHGELTDGTPYLLMELLAGESLRTRLQQTAGHTLFLETALRLCQQVAEAMAAAHAHGIVHRDLKPENLRLVPEPAAPGGERVKVLDFGIAHLSSQDEQLTLPSQGQLGTLAYMSPERCRGDERIDGRSDVYSLGCILYETLCGQPPFAGEPEHISHLHLKQHPRPPSQRADKVPPALDSPVLRLLAKEPSSRPSMEEAARLLARLRKRAERGELRTRSRTTRRLSFTALILGLGGAAALLAWYGVRNRSPESVFIQGGTYKVGHPGVSPDSQPVPLLTLDDFWIDRTEVTCRDFLRWLEQKEFQLKDRTEDGNTTKWVMVNGNAYYNTYLNSMHNCIKEDAGKLKLLPGTDRWPVTSVTWAAANSYCQEHGKTLPSEAQWEYAATSRGVEHHPWGNQPPSCDTTYAGFDSESKPSCGPFPLASVETRSRDRTLQGVRDLGGSVSEWVADCYQPSYPDCGTSCRNFVVQNDGQGGWLCPTFRVIRGGAWSRSLAETDPTRRDKLRADWATGYVGFRCVGTRKPSLFSSF